MSRTELRRRIREHDPEWLTRADNGHEPEWRRIKDVFVQIQHFKCGYCERPMPRPQHHAGDDATGGTWGGRREYDLEHFRPRGRAARWPTAESGFQYEFRTGEALDRGYPWLAHDCLNYLASCKTCNQDNKKAHFPIAGERGTVGDDVRRLDRAERPFLVNPVGAGDEKPEDMIAFKGFVAVPRGSRGHRRRRGTVIIDLLALNLRDDLILQRCNLITAMWPSLEIRRAGEAGEHDDAVREIARRTAAGSQHANCARCFEAVHATDRVAARRYYEAAQRRADLLQA